MAPRIIDLGGYAIVALLFTVALAVAARGDSLQVPTEKPSQFIWQTADGTYTNLPMAYKVEKQFTPSRDRLTPVTRTAPVWDWAEATAIAAEREAYYVSRGTGNSPCRYLQLGNTAGRGGGVEVCGDEVAEIREQRVLRKGDTTTTTDTVLTIDGKTVFTVRGRSWTHDPGEVERR